jgi:DNA-binding response OmpR family regulator
MPNSRKILIVDDDAELRGGLVEQLALHDEFDAVAVESGTKGVQTAKAGQVDLVIRRDCNAFELVASGWFRKRPDR